jgi:hypothetical protein
MQTKIILFYDFITNLPNMYAWGIIYAFMEKYLNIIKGFNNSLRLNCLNLNWFGFDLGNCRVIMVTILR